MMNSTFTLKQKIGNLIILKNIAKANHQFFHFQLFATAISITNILIL